jgi:hypothetical protein
MLGYCHFVYRNLVGFRGRSLHQATFERMLLTENSAGTRRLTNIIVHPHPQDARSFVVTAEHADDSGKISQYWFEAITPYVTMPESAKDRSVIAYLEQVRARPGGLSFSVAWWEHPRWVLTFYGAGAIIVIGLFWPRLVKRMLPRIADAAAAAIPAAANPPTPKHADPPVAAQQPVTPPTLCSPPDRLPALVESAAHREFQARKDDFYPTERRHKHNS